MHPAFRPGVLVEYDTTKPLFLEHDIRKTAGKVLRVWEEEDGVHFVAELSTPASELPSGVSVGGEYVVNEAGEIEALYIYEISLTNSPAYKAANYTIVATMKAQDITEVQALAQQLTELAATVQAQQSQIEELRSAVESMQVELQRLAEGYAALTQQSQTAEVSAQLQEFQARTAEQLKAITDTMISLAKAFSIDKKL
jgi:HAMP domain-containing protein